MHSDASFSVTPSSQARPRGSSRSDLVHALEEAKAAEVAKARERTAAAEADLAAKQVEQERKRLELEVRKA